MGGAAPARLVQWDHRVELSHLGAGEQGGGTVLHIANVERQRAPPRRFLRGRWGGSKPDGAGGRRGLAARAGGAGGRRGRAAPVGA